MRLELLEDICYTDCDTLNIDVAHMDSEHVHGCYQSTFVNLVLIGGHDLLG